MKRLVIAIAIFLGLITLCTMTMLNLIGTKKTLVDQVDELRQTIIKQDKESAIKLAEQLNESWNEKEATMMKYVRHDQLDGITCIIARLPSLLRYDQIGQMMAYLDEIEVLLDHTLESEIPGIVNLF